MTHKRLADSPIRTGTAFLRAVTHYATRYAAQNRILRASRHLLARRGAVLAPEGTTDHVLPVPTTPPEIVGELLTLVREQQAQLIAAAQRIGTLEAQLAARLTPEQARELREELAACQARLAGQPPAPQVETRKQKKRKKAKGGSL